MPDLTLVITLFLSEAEGYVGVFFGKNKRAGADRTRLEPVADRMHEYLGEQPWTPADFGHYGSIWYVNLADERNWPAIADWLVTEADRLEAAARYAMAEGPGTAKSGSPLRRRALRGVVAEQEVDASMVPAAR